MGTHDTGSITYSYDDRGNMLWNYGQSYVWNADNRLVQALVSGGDPKAQLHTMYYKYDHAGRRILEHKNSSGQRTRHFFNGLTEEVRKVSIGTHADDAFGFYEVFDGTTTAGWTSHHTSTPGTLVSQWDADRRSNVLHFSGNDQSTYNRGFRYGGNLSRTERVASFWVKAQMAAPAVPKVTFQVTTSAGTRYVEYHMDSTGTTRFDDGAHYLYYLDSSLNSGEWHRLERDLQADISALTPGVTLLEIEQVRVPANNIYLDDLRFSDSFTAATNVLAGGSIGHIVRGRTINQPDHATAPYEAADSWMHYDQVAA